MMDVGYEMIARIIGSPLYCTNAAANYRNYCNCTGKSLSQGISVSSTFSVSVIAEGTDSNSWKQSLVAGRLLGMILW